MPLNFDVTREMPMSNFLMGEILSVCIVAIPIAALSCVMLPRRLLKGDSMESAAVVFFGFAAATGIVSSIPFLLSELFFVGLIALLFFLGVVFSMIGFIFHAVIQIAKSKQNAIDK